jgi:hypothetical protein
LALSVVVEFFNRLLTPFSHYNLSQGSTEEEGVRPQRLPVLREDWPLGQGVLEQEEEEEGRGSPRAGGR